jgi:hypothetical protein
MIQFCVKKIRKSLNTPFYFEVKRGTFALRKYIHKTYVETGQLLSEKWKISDDGFSAESLVEWDCEQSYRDYLSDIIIKEHVLDPTNIYEQENDIETVVESENNELLYLEA